MSSFWLIIVWIFTGIFNIVDGINDSNHKVSLLNYICVWICLICTLAIENF